MREPSIVFKNWLLLTAVFVVVGLSSSQVFAELIGQARVIDGDTLELAGRKVRLHGIDAPETKQLCYSENGQANGCGQLAAKALTDLVAGHAITCQGGKVDRYGRLIGKCLRAEVDINQHMVLNGWALAYRAYSDDYVDAETSAKQARLGIWRGRFVPPWDWRRGKRLAETTNTDSSSCPIKANVNSNGHWIYHLLGGQFYEAVKIRPEQGDRCFETETEAEGAGFRRSIR